jgi:hypothetical protein
MEEYKLPRWNLKKFEKGLIAAFEEEQPVEPPKPKVKIGRPKKNSDEELKLKKKTYDIEYQRKRYQEDPEYRTSILTRQKNSRNNK